VTLMFLPLPDPSLTKVSGNVWGKIDVMRILPVERALYLDADVLVRGDVRELWTTDLKGTSLAAAVDIGHPMGHGDLFGWPYFNAGVLLMNLAKIRTRIDEVMTTARSNSKTRFLDQDTLNISFRSDWTQLSLRWNAQGLGTYASIPTAERRNLDLDNELHDPAIVHFTGAVHPSLGHVLNPWVQPYTAKPWGYAGAPRNPYAEEWWNMIEKTAWKGWRSSGEHEKFCQEAESKVIEEGVAEFRTKVKNARQVV